jgi:hypothetical protein
MEVSERVGAEEHARTCVQGQAEQEGSRWGPRRQDTERGGWRRPGGEPDSFHPPPSAPRVRVREPTRAGPVRRVEGQQAPQQGARPGVGAGEALLKGHAGLLAHVDQKVPRLLIPDLPGPRERSDQGSGLGKGGGARAGGVSPGLAGSKRLGRGGLG